MTHARVHSVDVSPSLRLADDRAPVGAPEAAGALTTEQVSALRTLLGAVGDAARVFAVGGRQLPGSASEIVPEALTAEQAAALCGVGRSKWWEMNSAGLTPAAIRLGDADHRRGTRWLRSELMEWLTAGAPPRDRWESVKNLKGGRRR